LDREPRLPPLCLNPRNGVRVRSCWAETAWTALAGLLTTGIAATLMSVIADEFWRDDFQSALMPCYVDINRAIHEGSYPLLSLSSWYSGCIGGEYQYGVFSVFHVAVLVCVFKLGLTLPQTANALVLIHVAVFGSGAFRLVPQIAIVRPPRPRFS
jgi:hypothetical protein